MPDGRTPYESAGAGEKFSKRIFRPEIDEDPQNDSQEAGCNEKNSSGASDLSNHQRRNCACISDVSELEQTLKQMTFTRSEAKRVIALVHSRTIKVSPSTSGSLNRHKNGDERDNFHAAGFSSRVLEEETASPAELAKAYKGSISCTGQASKHNFKLINNASTSTTLLKTPLAIPQHPTTIDNLPDELLVNIFIRLFAKQLAQMRSVSKSWNALLSQSSFVKSHLRRSMHSNDQTLLLFFYYEESLSNFKPFRAFPRRSPHLELTNFIKLPVNPRPEYPNVIRVIGSVNGLICSCYGDSIIQIWNPSLSAVLTLPPYYMPSNAHDSVRTYFRFGFDTKTNDYKVVKITGLHGPPTYAVKRWLKIEIYSMRKGTWQLINERFPSHITRIVNGDHVCVDGRDGHLHWLCCIGDKKDSKTIVAFDLGSETFREIPFPDSVPDRNRSNELGVLAGKLCVISRGWDVGFEVWVMEEYGVAESWVKRHVFSQFVDIGFTFGFTSHNEFAMKDDGSLVLYDPIANKRKVLGDYFSVECSDLWNYFSTEYADKIVEYVDSLVWVAPAEREIVDGAGKNSNGEMSSMIHY